MSASQPWSAGINGFPGQADATLRAGQVGQELNTHAVHVAYNGVRSLNPGGGTQCIGVTPGNGLDIDQPFTLSGTTVGRVVVPVSAVGEGADLRVSLYPDNAGVPNTANCLASTMIPASWISALTCYDGLENATTPLQTADTNALYASNSINVFNWPSPAGDSAGVASNSAFTYDGNYMIFVGGAGSGGASIGTVATAEYLGGNQLSAPVAQPSLPKPVFYPCVVTTPTTIVVAGGNNGSAVSNVWTASWDVNTGTIGQWSAQTALTSHLWGAGCASYGETVYVVGGTADGSSALRSVYHATNDNGQIGSWTSGPDLPEDTMSPMLVAINGWLLCIGGCTILASPYTAVWMAKIAGDGSLDYWRPGPSLQTAVYSYAPGWDVCQTANQVIVMGGYTGPSSTTASLQFLSITENTIGTWRATNWNPSFVQQVGAFDQGDGTWDLVNPVIAGDIYRVSTAIPVGLVSVPLFTTGLTNGATYHLVLQQHQTGDASDFLVISMLDSALPALALQSARNANSWSNGDLGFWRVPLEVYDTSTTGCDVFHSWDDPSSTGSGVLNNIAAQAITWVYDNAHMPIGRLQATVQPNDPLNSNPTFATGVSPWASTNGTFTQSNAQTHGGFAFSGLLTPAGGNALAYASTELCFIGASQAVFGTERWLMANSWVWVPTTWSGVSLSINWFDSNQVYISTTSNPVSVTGAAWTNLVAYGQAPSTAAYASLVPTLSGTPSASNTLYLSNAMLVYSPETVKTVSSALSIVYDPVTTLAVDANLV
jgi:hypothetical protein